MRVLDYGNTAMEHVWVWNIEEEKAIARAEIMAEHRMECGGEPCDWCDGEGGRVALNEGIRGSLGMVPHPQPATLIGDSCGQEECEVCHGFTPSTDR
jgi:hypothetical protein